VTEEKKYQFIDLKITIATLNNHPVMIENDSNYNILIYKKPIAPKRSYTFENYVRKKQSIYVDPYVLPNINQLVLSFEEPNE
jgi:hypothetical protein